MIINKYTIYIRIGICVSLGKWWQKLKFGYLHEGWAIKDGEWA
jgi:hypothetical protein